MSFLSSLLPALGGIGGAVLGSVIPGVGTALGASLGGSLGGALSSSAAANTQTNYGNQAIDFLKQQYGQTQENLAPYLQTGTTALGQLGQLTSPGGQQSALLNSPQYQWALGQGEDAIMNKRAAMGGALSGGTLRDLTQYGQGLASQQYGNVFNQLSQLAGMGQNAAVGLGGFGANTANNTANLLSQIGNVQGAGIMGGANAATGGINNWLLANALQQHDGGAGVPLSGVGGLIGDYGNAYAGAIPYG